MLPAINVHDKSFPFQSKLSFIKIILYQIRLAARSTRIFTGVWTNIPLWATEYHEISFPN
jgi:hypothetical protein